MSMRQHCLHGKCRRTAFWPVGKQIVRPGVGIKLPQIALPARRVPGRALLRVAKQRWALSGGGHRLTERVVAFRNVGEQAVGLRFRAHQSAEEAHPFRAAERRRLQIVGTLHQGQSGFLQQTIARALHRRHENSVGLQGQQAFYIGRHAAASISDAPLTQTLFEARVDSIGRVGHGHELLLTREVVEQGGVYGRKHHHAFQRCAHQNAFRQIAWHALRAGDEHIRLQGASLVPGIAHFHTGETVGELHAQEGGMAQWLCLADFRRMAAGEKEREEEEEGEDSVAHRGGWCKLVGGIIYKICMVLYIMRVVYTMGTVFVTP